MGDREREKNGRCSINSGDRRSVGVEEELLLVDSATGRALAVSSTALGEAEADEGPAGDTALTGELQRQQIETNSRPCLSLGELEAELRRCRRAAADAAETAGARVAALGTSPLPVAPLVSPDARYQQMVDEFALTARQQLICGCHIHVGVCSDEEGTAVLDRIRGWLPTLLALSANSPFWQGEDSGYASFRSQLSARWPSSGPTQLFGSAEAYHATVRMMVDSATILDEGMIYFDARLSSRYPTIEVRVPDVCLLVEDAVLLAALARALVETAAREWRQGMPPAPLRVEPLRLAMWRAGRSGLDEELIGPTGRPVPAEDAVHSLIGHVTPALHDLGDFEVVRELTSALLGRGNGAGFQRAIHRRGEGLAAVVAGAAAHTLGVARESI